jgi:DNA-binding NarL/FixJ family response regulator
MLKILIADDHGLLREGITRVLTKEFKELEVEGVGTGEDVLRMLGSQTWDALILDINLPDKHGIDVLKETKCLQPNLPVLILSFYPEKQYAIRALKAGASGYLTKESAPQELVAALRQIMQGGTYVRSKVADDLVSGLRAENPATLYQTLSDRELQVLCSLSKGKTISQIAVEFSLSVNTISTYRARLLEKLNLTTTAELIRYAIDNQLVE